MAQYIDKDALAAEIKRRKNICQRVAKANENENNELAHLYYKGKTEAYSEMLEFLDTFEVKEVDLDEKVDRIIEKNDWDCNEIDFYEFAKYFFELGLRSTITEEDCKLVWNIGDKIPYMPEEEFFKELLKRYKAQKGE